MVEAQTSTPSPISLYPLNAGNAIVMFRVLRVLVYLQFQKKQTVFCKHIETTYILHIETPKLRNKYMQIVQTFGSTRYLIESDTQHGWGIQYQCGTEAVKLMITFLTQRLVIYPDKLPKNIGNCVPRMIISSVSGYNV